MTEPEYDLFVIGAGSGGIRAARLAAGLGARVAVAEESRLGGTCVNVGCIPKKLFVYAAHYGADFHEAAGYGWRVPQGAFDWNVLLENKNREINRLNGIYHAMLEEAGATLVEGRAAVTGAHSVCVNGRTYRAKRILLAAGGRPYIPDIPGREHLISSDDAFFLERLPDSIVIVGGGYIAVEFAGIFHGLGVDTTLAYRGDLFLRGFDAEAREFLAGQLRQQGIKLLFNTEVLHVERRRGRLRVTVAAGAALAADLVMYATGRRPNTHDLGLDAAGVKLNERGAVAVDSEYRSSVPSIYAIGDITDRLNLTPVATAEGTALAYNLFGGQARRVDYRDVPTCVFSRPSLAAVGLTEEQARREYAGADVYASSFTPLKHTLTGAGERTLMKLIVHKDTDRVLGAHIVGAAAGEIIQGLAIALKAGAGKAVFDAVIGVHPTAAEEFVTMREPARRA